MVSCTLHLHHYPCWLTISIVLSKLVLFCTQVNRRVSSSGNNDFDLGKSYEFDRLPAGYEVWEKPRNDKVGLQVFYYLMQH